MLNFNYINMKKIILLLLAIPVLSFSQEKTDFKKSTTLSLNVLASDPAQIGLTFEGFQYLHKEHVSSLVINAGISSTTLDKNGYSITGNGFAIELGGRTYFSKNKNSGFYRQNFLSHSQNNFSKDGFNGKYTYWSLINADIGYKVIILKSLSIEGSLGYIWKWEVNTKSDIDNKDFQNLVPRAAIRLGYKF